MIDLCICIHIYIYTLKGMVLGFKVEGLGVGVLAYIYIYYMYMYLCIYLPFRDPIGYLNPYEERLGETGALGCFLVWGVQALGVWDVGFV